MKTTTLIRRSVVLFGLVALAASSVHAQSPPFDGVGGWPYGGSSSNPYNSNPNSNNNGNSNNSNNSNAGNGNADGSGGGDSSGSDTGSGSGTTSSGNGDVNGNSGNSDGGSSGSGSTGGDGGFSSSFGSGLGFPANGFDVSSVMNFPAAHGALAATAFGFLFPLGAILMRVTSSRQALFAHGFVQMLAYALYIAGAGLGLYLVNIMRIPSGAGLLDMAGQNAHPIIGIVLLVALFFQPILGVVHHSRFKKFKRRTWVSHVHLWTGRLGITLGIINGGLGFALAGTAGAPLVAYAVVSGVMWILWVLTALRGEYRRASTQDKDRKEKIIQEDRGYVPGVRGGGGADSSRPSSENADETSRAYPPPPPPPPGASMDMPSPPYTPGPHYNAHMAHVHQQPVGGEMVNMKEVMDRSDAVSYLSASHDEMNRGQV